MSTETQGSKNPLKSKTLWTAFLTPIVTYLVNKVPVIGDLISTVIVDNPDFVLTLVSGLVCAVFASLRIVTKDKISLK